MTQVTLNLPESIAREAEAAGLLRPEVLERLLREEMRRQAGSSLASANERAFTVEQLAEAWRDIGRPVAPQDTALPGDADAWSRRLDDLLALRQLEEDWDGQGARAPSPELVDSALRMVQKLRQQGIGAPCRVVPGLTGTVLIEWQWPGGTYAELELTQPGRGRWLVIAPDQVSRSYEVVG